MNQTIDVQERNYAMPFTIPSSLAKGVYYIKLVAKASNKKYTTKLLVE